MVYHYLSLVDRYNFKIDIDRNIEYQERLYLWCFSNLNDRRSNKFSDWLEQHENENKRRMKVPGLTNHSSRPGIILARFQSGVHGRAAYFRRYEAMKKRK
jgi:hypothetical protein